MDTPKNRLVDMRTGEVIDTTAFIMEIIPENESDPIMARPFHADDSTLRGIADALWGDGADTEWNSDTLDAIADVIRTFRPDLAP